MGANLLLSVFFLSLCSTSYSLLTVSTVAKMGLSCACTLTMATFVFPKKRYVLEIDEVPPPALMVRLMILMGIVSMILFLSGKACQLYTNLAYSSDLAPVEVNARAKIMRRGTMKAYHGVALELPTIGVGVTTLTQRSLRVAPGLASSHLSTMVLCIPSVLTFSGGISGVQQQLIGKTNM